MMPPGQEGRLPNELPENRDLRDSRTAGKVLIAAGGTGGHIYPAIALGEALARAYPEIGVRFLCGERELERHLYAGNGIDPIVFPARQIGAGIAGKLAGAAAAAANTMRAVRLIRREGFTAVVGMGGYVSGPAVMGGLIARRPCAIHEANSIPGKTNRWLAPHADLCAVHFSVTGNYLRSRNLLRVGMPIRSNITQGARPEALGFFGLDSAKRTLLVLGGSQGAKHLYATIMQALPELDIEEHRDVQILWSTGSANYDEMREQLARLSLAELRVELLPFISRMDLALAAADAALARAGASSIAELLACGVYALYIPFPSAIYDHQTLNAREVEKAGAGLVIEEKSLTAKSAAEALAELLKRTRPGARMQPLPDLDSRHAAELLADRIAGLAVRRAG